MRVTVWVRPRSGRTAVGGDHGGALVVRVRAAPEDGRATEEALRALAEALGVRRGALTLRSGHTSRTKVVEVDGVETALARSVEQLRSSGPAAPGPAADRATP
ncbi:MAG: DUF167 domain-containing protein [Acidimicrobiales bacterium]